MELRGVETLLEESGKSFNGIDPLRPVFREKLDGTRTKLPAIQEHCELNMEVVLREPLEEELAETRGWLEELRATR